jgi:hypothetical protein
MFEVRWTPPLQNNSAPPILLSLSRTSARGEGGGTLRGAARRREGLIPPASLRILPPPPIAKSTPIVGHPAAGVGGILSAPAGGLATHRRAPTTRRSKISAAKKRPSRRRATGARHRRARGRRRQARAEVKGSLWRGRRRWRGGGGALEASARRIGRTGGVPPPVGRLKTDPLL